MTPPKQRIKRREGKIEREIDFQFNSPRHQLRRLDLLRSPPDWRLSLGFGIVEKGKGLIKVV